MAQPMLVSDIPDPCNLEVEGEWLEVEGDGIGDDVESFFDFLVLFCRGQP